MKNLKQNLGMLCLAAAVLFIVAIVYFIVQEPLSEYNDQMATKESNTAKLVSYEKQKQEIDAKVAAEENELKKFKPFYESQSASDKNEPSLYGTMFDEIIKLAQANGLMIRSIETDMNPTYDPVFTNYSKDYNACEFKFFFVGSYTQLQSYLSDVLNKFKYMISISKLNVTSFSENPDYLLIKVSFTLYAKKPSEADKPKGMFKNQKAGA